MKSVILNMNETWTVRFGVFWSAFIQKVIREASSFHFYVYSRHFRRSAQWSDECNRNAIWINIIMFKIGITGSNFVYVKRLRLKYDTSRFFVPFLLFSRWFHLSGIMILLSVWLFFAEPTTRKKVPFWKYSLQSDCLLIVIPALI